MPIAVNVGYMPQCVIDGIMQQYVWENLQEYWKKYLNSNAGDGRLLDEKQMQKYWWHKSMGWFCSEIGVKQAFEFAIGTPLIAVLILVPINYQTHFYAMRASWRNNITQSNCDID